MANGRMATSGGSHAPLNAFGTDGNPLSWKRDDMFGYIAVMLEQLQQRVRQNIPCSRPLSLRRTFCQQLPALGAERHRS